ncbi:hypothetical protein [Cellulomonas soli]
MTLRVPVRTSTSGTAGMRLSRSRKLVATPSATTWCGCSAELSTVRVLARGSHSPVSSARVRATRSTASWSSASVLADRST